MRSQPRRENATRSALAALVMSRYWRATDAEQVVEAWQRSGESASAFAGRHGFSVRRLLRWRGRLGRSATPLFHPVGVVTRAEPITTRVAALELELRSGRRIHVHRGFDPTLLEELVRTVESWGC